MAAKISTNATSWFLENPDFFSELDLTGVALLVVFGFGLEATALVEGFRFTGFFAVAIFLSCLS